MGTEISRDLNKVGTETACPARVALGRVTFAVPERIHSRDMCAAACSVRFPSNTSALWNCVVIRAYMSTVDLMAC
jgi:hypothetical protein